MLKRSEWVIGCLKRPEARSNSGAVAALENLSAFSKTASYMPPAGTITRVGDSNLRAFAREPAYTRL